MKAKKEKKQKNTLKTILVTGGLGFIGFNALQLWKKIRPQYTYIVVDSETYAAQFMLKEKKEWCKENHIDIFNFDIFADSQMIEQLVEAKSIDAIVNFAAESHVDNSIKNPNIFFDTNVIGTVNLLNIAKKFDIRFQQIGTDEVYGETWPESWEYESFHDSMNKIEAEEKPLVPSSPYSSSKASADMIALSYHHTFGTRVTVSRCTNNFGPWQHCEKLIGTVISKALNDQNIPVYGKGNQQRHWIYVDEHNTKIMEILEKGKTGQIYNIAPAKENWITNITLIKFILKTLKKPQSLIEHVTDRLGHDSSYFLYGTDFCQSYKIWKEDMKSTIEWYMKNMSNEGRNEK